MHTFLALFLGLSLFTSLTEASLPSVSDANKKSLLTLYRELHSQPELSLKEEKTAAKIAQALKGLGIEVTEAFGGTGIVGKLNNGKGPTVLIRTDLDGLPVTEKTGLPFASTVTSTTSDGNSTGVMHACGHDIHMTSFVGTAQWLVEHKDRWQGTVLFVGQPAEEIGKGASLMLNEGLYKKFPKPDYALALHVDAELESGKVGYRPGPALANVDSVDIVMKGRGGHGATPHATIDPVVLASHLVMDLQTLVSRENNPLEPAVITVGVIKGGTKRNIIADSVELQLTVRSYTPQVRKLLLDGIARKAKAIAQGAGAPEPTIQSSETPVPALINEDKLVSRVAPALKNALGDENVILNQPVMGAEDFSRFSEGNTPIFMFRLGSIEAARLKKLRPHGPSLHSALYYPDAELTITTGVRAMTAAVVELLPKS